MEVYDGSSSEEIICGICHQKGQGCCFFTPSAADYIFPLSIGEIKKICLQEGYGFSDFIVQESVAKENYDFFVSFDENFAYLLPHFRKLRLRTVKNSCFFLTEKGCALHKESRPLYCRMYPFWVTEGAITVLVSSSCLAQKEETNKLTLSQKTGNELDRIEELYAEFKKNAKEHFELYTKLTNLR